MEDHDQWVIGITPSKKDHNLLALWKIFLQIAAAYHNDPSDEAAVAVLDCINEFAQVDPGSFAFRFARDKRSDALIPLGFGTIDLVNVLDVMNGIQNFFECANLDFNHKRNIACKIEDDARQRRAARDLP